MRKILSEQTPLRTDLNPIPLPLPLPSNTSNCDFSYTCSPLLYFTLTLNNHRNTGSTAHTPETTTIYHNQPIASRSQKSVLSWIPRPHQPLQKHAGLGNCSSCIQGHQVPEWLQSLGNCRDFAGDGKVYCFMNPGSGREAYWQRKRETKQKEKLSLYTVHARDS